MQQPISSTARAILGAVALFAVAAGSFACVGVIIEDGDDKPFETASAVSAYCTATVIGVGTVDVETDYLPHVVACEIGGASFEALKAQAVAARSYLYYKLASSGSILDGTGDQVYSCSNPPGPEHYAAVQATAGQVLHYSGVTIAAFYVAGAYQSPPGCAGGSNDPTGTEHYVTYNLGASGSNVEQTTLGWVDPGNLYNRGCMSQNGAACLSDDGWTYDEILELYYGADIVLEYAVGPCTAGAAPTCDSTCDYCWYGTSNEGSCPASWNGTGDGCDCGCQFTDPDCSASPPPPPPPPASCDPECDYCWYGTPSEGSCPSSWNGTGDGCDCGCQFTDPDCSASPPPPPPPPPPPASCDPECDYCWYGTPSEGSCPSSWNGTGDGCDCGCQFTDPDCSAPPPPPPPAGCVADAYEPNDGSPGATPVSSGVSYCGLSICTGDYDWFGFNISSGFTATITFSNADDDLDLEIYSSLTLAYVSGSYSLADIEQASLSGLPSGLYWARVFEYNGAENPSYCFNVSTF